MTEYPTPRLPDLIVTHPGASGSVYQLVLACNKAGFTTDFYTGIYSPSLKNWVKRLPKPWRQLCRGFFQALPHAWRQKITRQLSRRQFADLPAEQCHLLPWGEILYLVSARLFPRHPAVPREVMNWRNRRFDRKMAKNLHKFPVSVHPWGVITQDTSGLQTLQAAKNTGRVAILHQMIGHIAIGKQVLSEEAKLQPDWADSLHFDAPNHLVETCLREALIADYILASSDYVRETLLQIGVASEHIRLLPYGVDTRQFQPVTAGEFEQRFDALMGGRQGVGRRKFRLLYVGQISQRKGLAYLLDAMALLNDPRIELVFLGGLVGEGRGLRRQTAELGKNFLHVPNLPHHEIASIYRTADIMVYPSLHEGSALAIYEGLASGLPVITTNPSGSVVRDTIEGRIVPTRNADALADAISDLYHNHDLRQKMSLAARARAEHYSWSLYQKTLAGYLHEMKKQR